MTYKLLPALHLNDHYATICVRVTRKWEYRGPADDGDVQHVDLVLADQEANVMHAEIPQEVLFEFINQVEEGRVYEIRRFRIANAKSFYKPVEGRYMIKFTVHTQIATVANPPTTYPRYTYRLTAFEDLSMLVGNTKNFIDVLGVIVQISEIEMIQSSNYAPVATRKLILEDVSGFEIQVTLWGQRATEFTVIEVYNNEEAKPVVVLLVGCLMKSYRAQDYLSGSSACKWYFNPDIPEAEEFYDRYRDQRIEIRHVAPAPAQPVKPQPQPQQESRYLRDLLNMDPYDFPRDGCRCTVTIARLVPDVSWWFPSCMKCAKTCTREPNGYICYNCNSKNYKHKYKLVFVASDGTGEAEMICFGQLAQRMIGKPVDQVIRTMRRDEEFPPDVAGIVSQKYTFVVTVANQSFYSRNMSFMVSSIVTSYGKQRAIPHTGSGSSNRHLNYPRSSSASTSERNNATSISTRNPPAAVQRHTPPPSPVTTETLAKDGPPLETVDTPESRPSKKRLTYDTVEGEEESADVHFKRSKHDRMKAPLESIPDTSAADLASKRPSPNRTKTAVQKSGESRTHRYQKNK
ncbi:unnamed protein product [Urochloa humidicola]